MASWKEGNVSHFDDNLNCFVFNENKKGKNMNDQISKDMAEANKMALPVEPIPAPKTVLQTEADVGEETPENRVN